MAFPRDPRDTVVELYKGGWIDLTAGNDVYGREPLTIAMGRADESSSITPATCSFTLNNRTGKYNPRNPLGPYYKQIGRNTPVRIRVRTSRDQFSRTSVNSWGSTPNGEAWTVGGNGSPVANEFQVAGSTATHKVPSTATFRRSYLAGVTYRNVEVRITLSSVGFTDVLGGPLEPANLFVRGHESPSVDYYLARVTIEADQSVKIGILQVGGVFVASPITVPGLTYTGQALGVALQAECQTLRAKVWDASIANNEPYGWHVYATGAGLTGGAALTSGYVGVRSGVASTNTNTLPITFTYSDFQVSIPRFSGEISSWNQQWSDGIVDAVSVVEAADVLRRLGQGATAPQSAPRRYIPTSSPDVYWPLEDLPLAGSGQPVVGTSRMQASGDTDGSRQWGQGTLAPWLPNTVLRAGVTNLRAVAISQPNFVDWWSVTWVMAGGKAHNDFAIAGNPPGAPYGATAQVWVMAFSSSADDVTVTDASATPFSVTYPTLFDGGMHHMEFTTNFAAGSISWYLAVDGAIILNQSMAASSLQPVAAMEFRNLVDPSSDSLVIGHVTVNSQSSSPGAEREAVFGWRGETAGDRILRICLEEGISFTRAGSEEFLHGPIVSVAMGPQHQDTPLTVIAECVQADMGELYSPRGVLGLEYRTYDAIANQASVLDLVFTSDHLAPPLEPVDDDQLTRNAVTATRRDGASFEATQVTGPLSVASPSAGGIGVYDTSVTVNVETDDQVADTANWLVHLGTVDGARYPQVRVSLGRPAVANNPALANAAMSVTIGERITISGATAIGVYDTINLIVRGIVEDIDAFEHVLTFNCTPEEPYHIGILDSVLLDSDTTTLNEDLDTTETGVDVAIADGTLWTHAAGDFAIMINGERMTVTAVSGVASPQTFTVTRSVNGVVKNHATGSTVSFADPQYIGLI